MDTDLTTAFGPKRERLLYLVEDCAAFVSDQVHICRAARQLGFEVVLVGPADAPEDAEPADGDAEADRGSGAGTGWCRLERDGLRFIPLRMPLAAHRARDRWACGRALVAMLRAEEPTIVHAVGRTAALMGGIAARLAGVPGFVAELSGIEPAAGGGGGWRSHLHHKAMLRLLGLATAPHGRILVQTPEDAHRLEKDGGLAAERIILTQGTGVDAAAFRPLPQPETHPPCVTVASPMAWSAGIASAVEAQRILLADGVPFRLLLCGRSDQGDPDAIPERQLQDWEAFPGIFWLGAGTDIREVLRETHIALLPSPGGGSIPRFLVQAAACARPIVTTDVPGCNLVVRSWQTGLLVPPGDARSLADALRILVEDDEVRTRFGAAARAHFESAFTLDHARDRMAEVYRDVRLAAKRLRQT